MRDDIYQILQTILPKVELSDETLLLGGVIDSMGLLTAVVEIEERAQEKLKKNIRLVSEHAMSQSRSPFKDVGSLVAYVEELIR